MTRPHVKVVPESSSDYVSLVYAGLHELRARGEISLELVTGTRQNSAVRRRNAATIGLEVAQSTNCESVRRIELDFTDGGAISSPALLENADVYYKRSYRSAIVEQLTAIEQAKVKPFGLHYACTSPRQSLRDRWSHIRTRRAIKELPYSSARLTAIPSDMVRTASLSLAKFRISKRLSNMPPLVSELEADAKSAAEPRIFYRTRVYSPGPRNARRGELENEKRVAVIRALKKEFGDRFVGGLRDSEFARKKYPDCIFPTPINWRQHVALMKSCLIAVTTAGLHDSTDWKLAEYLAASRCTVSERLRYDLPHELREGEEILVFDSPDQCVEACANLLSNPDLAEKLRQGAQSYYQQHLAPAQILRRVIGIG